jgi:hypothetical protein
VALERGELGIQRQRPCGIDADKLRPVDARAAEPGFPHHGVAGFIPELAGHIHRVIPRLAGRLGDDGGDDFRHVDLPQPLVIHHQRLGIGGHLGVVEKDFRVDAHVVGIEKRSSRRGVESNTGVRPRTCVPGRRAAFSEHPSSPPACASKRRSAANHGSCLGPGRRIDELRRALRRRRCETTDDPPAGFSAMSANAAEAPATRIRKYRRSGLPCWARRESRRKSVEGRIGNDVQARAEVRAFPPHASATPPHARRNRGRAG